jgi:hypothetical protein
MRSESPAIDQAKMMSDSLVICSIFSSFHAALCPGLEKHRPLPARCRPIARVRSCDTADFGTPV